MLRPARQIRTRLTKLGMAVLGIAVFILALQLLKEGAQGLVPVMKMLSIEAGARPVDMAHALGFGWLMAYMVLSGSPVAAVSLTLLSGGIISDVQTFAMITGSRLGASFIVLFVGFIYHLRGQPRIASVSIGVLALLVTATIYLPAMALGYGLLTQGSFNALRFGAPVALNSMIEVIYDPIVHWTVAALPRWVVFLVGLGVLLVAFNIFDRALPEIDPERSGFERIADMVYRPFVMFMLGLAITTLTLSVSVSLTMLVPLSAKGYVRRENLIPYIMGANISTFVDTLFASLLVNHERAFTIVLTEMLSVGSISLVILLLFYAAYQRQMETALEAILRNNRTLAIFLGSLLLIPLALLLFRL